MQCGPQVCRQSLGPSRKRRRGRTPEKERFENRFPSSNYGWELARSARFDICLHAGMVGLVLSRGFLRYSGYGRLAAPLPGEPWLLDTGSCASALPMRDGQNTT